jgi:hypothetical protein
MFGPAALGPCYDSFSMNTFLSDKVEQLLSWVVPDAMACRGAAAEMVARYPGVPAEQLARQVVKHAQKQGATIGGVTGFASSPLTMVPAALADIAGTLRIEGTMVGVVAALLDPASLDDPHRFRADVMATVFPAAFSQALRQVGIRAGETLTKNFVRRAVGKDSLEAVIKVAGHLLGSRLTGKSVLTKGVPLVGVGIGAGWNWLEVSAVGGRAIAYHTGQPVGVGKLKELGRRLIPERLRRKSGQADEPPPGSTA